MTGEMQALSIDGVTAGYQGNDIISEISIDITPGEIFTVIGPNGSGKSTLIKVMAGMVPARKGEIRLGDTPITHLSAPARVSAGIAYVPQEFNIFPNMTIGENLKVAAEFAGGPAQSAERRDRVLAMFPEAGHRLRTRAGLLSGGQRQLLAFACAMMANPKVLLLDEPSAGLSPKLVGEIIDKVKEINSSGVTVFMIEQNVTEALRIADRVTVLVNGTIRVLAKPAEFGTRYDLHKLYLN